MGSILERYQEPLAVLGLLAIFIFVFLMITRMIYKGKDSSSIIVHIMNGIAGLFGPFFLFTGYYLEVQDPPFRVLWFTFVLCMCMVFNWVLFSIWKWDEKGKKMVVNSDKAWRALVLFIGGAIVTIIFFLQKVVTL